MGASKLKVTKRTKFKNLFVDINRQFCSKTVIISIMYLIAINTNCYYRISMYL